MPEPRGIEVDAVFSASGPGFAALASFASFGGRFIVEPSARGSVEGAAVGKISPSPLTPPGKSFEKMLIAE
jgi:hypothetical protein